MITDAHWTLLLPPCSDPSCRVPAGRGRPSAPSTSRSPCRCRRLAEHTRRTANQKSHGWNAWKIRRNITENCKKAGFMMIYADWCGFLLMITMPDVSYVQCHLPYHHIYINHLRPSWGIPKTIAKTIAGWWCWLCPSEENDGVKVNGVGMTYIIFLKWKIIHSCSSHHQPDRFQYKKWSDDLRMIWGYPPWLRKAPYLEVTNREKNKHTQFFQLVF